MCAFAIFVEHCSFRGTWLDRFMLQPTAMPHYIVSNFKSFCKEKYENKKATSNFVKKNFQMSTPSLRKHSYSKTTPYFEVTENNSKKVFTKISFHLSNDLEKS